MGRAGGAAGSDVELSVVLPTYNEREALPRLRPRLEAAVAPGMGELLVVDDDSPDGTGAYVAALSDEGRWRLTTRRGARGLASAVVEGLRLSRGRLIVVMDADGSHPPEVIPRLIEPLRSGAAEFVLASRFVAGGSDTGLVGYRRAISWGASRLARGLTPVRDPMSGFFAFRREILERGHLAPVGYKIGLEILVKCSPRPVLEIPFHFQHRLAGVSKLGARQMAAYGQHLARLYRYRLSEAYRASRTR